MGPYGTICDHMWPYVTICDHMWPYVTIWDHMGPYGTIWDHMGPYGTIWDHKWPYVTICDHMWPYGTIWDHMGPYGTIWDHMGPYGTKVVPKMFKYARDLHETCTVYCALAGYYIQWLISSKTRTPIPCLVESLLWSYTCKLCPFTSYTWINCKCLPLENLGKFSQSCSPDKNANKQIFCLSMLSWLPAIHSYMVY